MLHRVPGARAAYRKSLGAGQRWRARKQSSRPWFFAA